MLNAVDFITGMQAHIENLVKLQEADLERARLTLAARSLPVELAQAQATLTAAERQAADISSSISHEESLRNRLEREIAAHRQKTTRFRTQLDAVKTPEQAEAIEHEIRFAESEASRLENEEFTSLEHSEALEIALAAARTEVESAAAILDKSRARIAVRQQEYNAELATLNIQREALRKLIEPEHLTRYDRLLGSRGTGIARVDNQQCTGCRMGVRPQMWNQLREGELLTCDSCARLLYWDPAMAPAPIPPQPATASKRRISKAKAKIGD